MSRSTDTQTTQQKPSLSRGLYALADADAAQARGLDIVECACAMLGAGVSVVQLRAKGRSSGQVVSWLEQIVRQSGLEHPPLIQNDRADWAEMGGANGVHLGQDDLPLESVLSHFPQLLRGVSTHDLKQLSVALESNVANYVAFGPVFSTSSKQNPEPSVGLSLLKEAQVMAREKHVPLVAIGGVSMENLQQVAMRSDLVAAIGLLLPPVGANAPYTSIETQCRNLHELIVNCPSS